MGNTLKRTRTVLDMVGLPGPPTYKVKEEEEGARGHIVTLDIDVWSDMNEPRQITVTVEPGDRLNMKDGGEKPLLGLATTEELLGELAARVKTSGNQFAHVLLSHVEFVQGQLKPEELAYRTVD